MYDILNARQAARVIGCGEPEVRQKPFSVGKLSGLSVQHYRANRLSVVPIGCLFQADALSCLDDNLI